MGLINNISPLKENLEQHSCKPQQEPKNHLTYLGNLLEIQQQQSATYLHSQPGHDFDSNKNAFLHGHSSRNELYTSNSSSFSYFYKDVDPFPIPHLSQSQLEIETVSKYYIDENGFVKECHQIDSENRVLKLATNEKRKNMDQQETKEGRLKKKLKQQNTGSTLIEINSRTQTSEFSPETRENNKALAKEKDLVNVKDVSPLLASVSSASDGPHRVDELANEMLSKTVLLSRSAFDSAQDYAVYVRDRVAIGMRVRCCLSFLRNRSKLQVGDTGVVVHLDHNGHLHDRNVEVKWNHSSRNRKCRVQFIQIELLPNEETKKTIVKLPKKLPASNQTGVKPKKILIKDVIAKPSVVPVRLIVQNNQKTNSAQPTPVAFKTVSKTKAVTTVTIQAPKQPKILKIISSSATMPQKKIAASLPTAIENGTSYLIPTHQLAELQLKLQQQFPGFRGTVTIPSIKLIDSFNSSIQPLLTVPEFKQNAPSPFSISLTQQQQPLNSCTKSTAPNSLKTAQNRSVVKPVHLLQPVQVPVGNRICLSNPAKPLSIIIKKDVTSQPLERKSAVKKRNVKINILPAPSNVRSIPSNKKPIASIQEDQALNKSQKYAEIFGICTLKNFNEEQANRFQELALDEGLDLNYIDSKGRSPLLLLCSFNQSEHLRRYIEILLKRNTVDINWKDNDNCSALTNLSLYYKGNGLMDIFRLLISRGIDVNICNNNQWSTLCILAATYIGSDLIEIIRLLVEHNAKDKKGWAAHFLCNRGFTHESEIVKMLQQAFVDNV